MHCTKTAKLRITQTTPYDSPETLSFFDAKDLYKIPMASHPTGAPNAGGVGKIVFRTVEESPSQTPYRRECVSIRYDGPRPRRCAWRKNTRCHQYLWWQWQSKLDDHSYGPVDIDEVGCMKVC